MSLLCEAWDFFKILLQRCPNNGFEEVAQLSIFYNGLKHDTKMNLDATAGGTVMIIDVEQATRIIDDLALTNYQEQHGTS